MTHLLSFLQAVSIDSRATLLLYPIPEAAAAEGLHFGHVAGRLCLSQSPLSQQIRAPALLASATVVVRGPKPIAALRSRGVRIDLSAKDPYTTAEVPADLAALSLAANLNSTLVASIGPVSTAALTHFGVKAGLEASPPKLGLLVNALDAALSPH